MNRTILICLFIATSLACGVVTTLPTPPAPLPIAIETEVYDSIRTAGVIKAQPRMIVCKTDPADGGLWVRAGAGIEFPLAQPEPLKDGKEVTIIGAADAPDGGLWYQIVGGFVNAKYVCDK